jgi:hypothetical protein
LNQLLESRKFDLILEKDRTLEVFRVKLSCAAKGVNLDLAQPFQLAWGPSGRALRGYMNKIKLCLSVGFIPEIRVAKTPFKVTAAPQSGKTGFFRLTTFPHFQKWHSV